MASQSGSTKKYVYVLANWNRSNNWSNSQELIRVKKSTMEIDKIWTFKVWNGSAKYPRIFLNADVIDDNTLLALFHNAYKHCYEYWKISRSGDSFKAKEVGQPAATSSAIPLKSRALSGTVPMTFTILPLTTTSLRSGQAYMAKQMPASY